MRSLFFLLITISYVTCSFGQKAVYEEISYFDLSTPNQPLESVIKTYQVLIETDYTLTKEALEAESLAKFEEEIANYDKLVKESELEYEKKLKDHESDILKAEERYNLEMKNFKALSMVERMLLTEQGKEPKLILPSKPQYIKPREPIYTKPNPQDHLVFDNEVLADRIELHGYEKGGNDVLFMINIPKMKFKENGGSTYYSQPASLKLMRGDALIHKKNFYEDSKFLTESASSTINLDRFEKNNVNKIIRDINLYINNEFGYTPIEKKVKIAYPKNKSREYDVLENAKIKAISAYKKLSKNTPPDMRALSKMELEKIRMIWRQELEKVDYKNSKAIMNPNVAKMIFFNLLQVALTLKDKVHAEETLNAMQNRLIDLDLDGDEKRQLDHLEMQIYKI